MFKENNNENNNNNKRKKSHVTIRTRRQVSKQSQQKLFKKELNKSAWFVEVKA